MATLGELDQARAAAGQTGAMPRSAYAAPSRSVPGTPAPRVGQQLRGLGKQVAQGVRAAIPKPAPSQQGSQMTLGQMDKVMRATGINGAMPRGYDSAIIQRQMAGRMPNGQ